VSLSAGRADPALLPGDPTRTVHFVLARRVDLLTGGSDTPSGGDVGDGDLAWSIVSDETDPDLRSAYAGAVRFAWGVLAVACVIALVVFGIAARELVGKDASDIVLALGVGAVFFCLAGYVNAYWRRVWFVSRARRHAEQDGVGSHTYAAAMRGILPRNSSLIWQAAIGILASLIALS